MKSTILLSIISMLLLSGCSGNISGEKRGFIYKTAFVEFTCAHEPSKTNVNIEKTLLGELGKFFALLADKDIINNGQFSDINTFLNGLKKDRAANGNFSEIQHLVKYCKQLIDKETIQ